MTNRRKMYAVSVTAGKEMAVLEKLNKTDGVKGYVPRCVVELRRGGFWRKEEKILIPGYVFIECKFNYNIYYKIKGITHVHSWIGKGIPSMMCDEDAEFIKFMANGGEAIPPQSITGSFLQRTIIKDINKRQRRIKVQFSVMGKTHTVTFGYLN